MAKPGSHLVHPPLPPLESGDRLSLAEFRRRYEAMPGLKKAELIGGVVYVQQPVNPEFHGSPHLYVAGWIVAYLAATPGTQGADNSTVRLDEQSEPQPDVFLRILPEHGGQSRTVDDGWVEGAPELAFEVSASRATYDLHDKRRVYQQHGVREYVVWRVYDREVDWFVLEGGRYQRLAPEPDGTLRSRVFPGLWLDPAALVDGDLAAVLALVQEGVASPGHAAFVERLARAKGD